MVGKYTHTYGQFSTFAMVFCSEILFTKNSVYFVYQCIQYTADYGT